MKRLSLAALAAAALVLGHLQLTAAENARFRHLLSVYADDKGGGLTLPEGVACDATGRFVVGDTGNDRLLRFTFQDKTVNGGTEIRLPELLAPSRVHLNSKGEIYALDSKRRRIVHLGAEGDLKAVLGFPGVPSPATIVPKSFALDSADNLYVLDIFSARVLVLSPEGQFQKALALPPDTAFVSEVNVDFAGNILLLDSIARRLYTASKEAASFSLLGAALTEALPTLPTYVTASRGTIFIVEGTEGSIVTLGRDGSFLTRQLTSGRTEGRLNHPSQICISDRNEAFVADRDNSRVQVFAVTR